MRVRWGHLYLLETPTLQNPSLQATKPTSDFGTRMTALFQVWENSQCPLQSKAVHVKCRGGDL